MLLIITATITLAAALFALAAWFVEAQHAEDRATAQEASQPLLPTCDGSSSSPPFGSSLPKRTSEVMHQLQHQVTRQITRQVSVSAPGHVEIITQGIATEQ